jgi:hypothetical protein
MSLPIVVLAFSIFLIWFARWFWPIFVNLRRRHQLAAHLHGPPTNPIWGNLSMFPKCKYEWTKFLIDESNKALADGHSMIRWWVTSTRLAIWTLDAESSKVF